MAHEGDLARPRPLLAEVVGRIGHAVLLEAAADDVDRGRSLGRRAVRNRAAMRRPVEPVALPSSRLVVPSTVVDNDERESDGLRPFASG